MAVTLEASTPARADRAVVFACDGQYARYAMLAAEQIARLHPARDFDICLCYMDERPPEPAGPRASRGALLPGDDGGPLRRAAARPGADAGRLPAAGAAGGLRRGVPAAPLSRRGRLRAGGRLRRAARGRPREPCRRGGAGTIRSGGRRGDGRSSSSSSACRRAPYFNAGVMLIDVAGFNARGSSRAASRIGRENREVMIRHDQNLLNATLKGDWAELSPKWNWQYTWASRLFEAMEDANVVHFIGPRKPWKDERGSSRCGSSGPTGRSWRRTSRTSRSGRTGRCRTRTRAFCRRMLVRHLLALGQDLRLSRPVSRTI